MKKSTIHIILFLLLATLLSCNRNNQPKTENLLPKTEDFSFHYDGKKYSGFVDIPSKKAQSLIILIPGSGRTDFLGEGGFANFFKRKRDSLLAHGFAVCAWDKQGCGKTEGEFKEGQSLTSSVEEGLAAIAALRKQKIPGAKKIGLWGVSRGGWICPLMIERDPNIAFWISVNGPDQFDNYRYLLETNFRIEGSTKEEVEVLMQEWDFHMKTMREGDVVYEDYIEKTKNLFKNAFYTGLGEKRLPEEEFYAAPDYYKTSGDIFDKNTGVRILAPDFEATLNKIECPVLAIFSEQDTQIDWRKTNALYQKTIGKNPNAKLDILALPNCNHLLMQCQTGGMFENLEPFGYELCEGYFEGMLEWLDNTN